jgi:preprotein translocase SecE subunit
VARDRKRAKQRRVRRGTTAGGHVEHAPPVSKPVRADLPGAFEHTGDVDEFDAALIRGGAPRPEDVVGVPVPTETGNGAPAETANGDLGADEDLLGDDLLQTPALASGRGGDGNDGPTTPAIATAGEARPSGAPLREGNRAIAFLRASWAELQRVQWPDRRQVTQATAVVLGFVAIAGAYLGLADYVAKEIVEHIL